MDQRDIDWERLDRYVTGEGTPEEREMLRHWAASDPTVEMIAEVMRTAQHLPAAALGEWDARRSWDMVARRLGLPNDVAEAVERERVVRPGREMARPVLQLTSAAGGRRRQAWRKGLVAAAVVLVVLGAGWWADRRLATHAPLLASEMMGREHTTLRGQRLVIYLPDRTQVTLAPESRLRLTPDYGRDARIVDLQGQAYFVVTHDSRHPFAVRSHRMIAQDLGTRFVVRAYPDDSVSTVVVAEGLVSLASLQASGLARGDSLLLAAGDLGRVASTGGLLRTRGMSIEPYLAWTAGALQLRHTPIRDAVIELSRWYDVDIDLADPSIGGEEVTAAFKEESALAAVDAIAAAAGLVVEQSGNRFTLRRKHD